MLLFGVVERFLARGVVQKDGGRGSLPVFEIALVFEETKELPTDDGVVVLP